MNGAERSVLPPIAVLWLSPHEPQPLHLLFPLARSPEPSGPGIRRDNESLEATSTQTSQPVLSLGHETTAKSCSASVGGNGEAIDRTAPAVPSGDDRTHDLTLRIGDDERERVTFDEFHQTRRIVCLRWFSLGFTPQREDGRDV